MGKNKKSILIVDDSYGPAHDLYGSLTEIYIVSFVTSLDSAWKRLEEAQGYDLLILDLCLAKDEIMLENEVDDVNESKVFGKKCRKKYEKRMTIWVISGYVNQNNSHEFPFADKAIERNVVERYPKKHIDDIKSLLK